MIDIVNKETRSRMMAGIRGKNTKPEIMVRSNLHKLGFRFRLNSRIGHTRPDLVLRKYKAAIFVHGCFWHQHVDCRYSTIPKSNVGFWTEKLGKNRLRDIRNIEELQSLGWRTAIVWECGCRKHAPNIMSELAEWLTYGGQHWESKAAGEITASGKR